MTDGRPALRLLAQGVASLAGLEQENGTLHDPVFDTPTQYGSAYYAWCCAALGQVLEGREGAAQRKRAARLLSAAVAHTADPELEPYPSGFDRRTLSVTGRLNHRDFTWPPILKTYLALQRMGVDLDPALAEQLGAVQVEQSFWSRPPSNWAAVWMSGEWLRMQLGLSPTRQEQFDKWIDSFFADGQQTGFNLELGMYLERGLPNAYDLFTRMHFTDLLLSGYVGRNRDRLESFLAKGLHRSLVMQLSDGSLASGYRSTGQTWVLGAQIALFTGSRALGLGTADEAEAARLGAWRAFASLASWQRSDGVFSPVQNLLDPRLRVGYEAYTADGHYSPLALAFLASALVAGFGTDERPTAAQLDDRAVRAVAEGAPTHRGVAHRGRISVALQTQPDDDYDATGLVDVSFGSGRLLNFVTAARHLSGGPWLTPGLAVRRMPGASLVSAVCGRLHELVSGLRSHPEGGLSFETRILPLPEATNDDELADQGYRCAVSVTHAGLDVLETTPGRSLYRTLLIPYLHDYGGGELTAVFFTDSGVRFHLGEEWVNFSVVGAIERRADLPSGYENRRGLCGLVRLDLAKPGDLLAWSITSSDNGAAG